MSGDDCVPLKQCSILCTTQSLSLSLPGNGLPLLSSLRKGAPYKPRLETDHSSSHLDNGCILCILSTLCSSRTMGHLVSLGLNLSHTVPWISQNGFPLCLLIQRPRLSLLANGSLLPVSPGFRLGSLLPSLHSPPGKYSSTGTTSICNPEHPEQNRAS